jgi:hypothetical protein
MKKLLVVVLVAGIAGAASAAEVYWTAQHLGGDAATWEDANNWSADFSNVYGLPGATDNARITGTSWIAGYPTLSTVQTIGGLYMGLETAVDAQVASLDIMAAGGLTTTSTDGWNDGVQIGWYSDAVLTSAGTVDTSAGNGGTSLGLGDAANGFGNATLNMTGGSWTTAALNFNTNSVNHVQLDGGVMDAGTLQWFHVAGQTMDITGGSLILDGDQVAYLGWVNQAGMGNLSINGAYDNIAGLVSYDAGSDTTTVIPEPATLGMVVLLGGGILWIRKRLMI